MNTLTSTPTITLRATPARRGNRGRAPAMAAASAVARLAFAALTASLASCDRPRDLASSPRAIVVFNAGALTRPLREALDSFARGETLDVSQESAGSLETVRKITELGKRPDVVALADTALFSAFLRDRIAGPVTPLGRSRMVLAYTPNSRYADRVDSTSWVEILLHPDVETGRSAPELDPAGYRALMVYQLAERHYHAAGLARRLEDRAPARNIRPKSADLVALLQTGNLDYAWQYESVARAAGLRYVRLPAEMDLGDDRLAATYAEARVRIHVLAAPGDSGSIAIRGAPIIFGIAALKAPPNDGVGSRFITYLLSVSGRRVLVARGLEPVDARASVDTR